MIFDPLQKAMITLLFLLFCAACTARLSTPLATEIGTNPTPSIPTSSKTPSPTQTPQITSPAPTAKSHQAIDVESVRWITPLLTI
jgi:hypothetical protein